MAFSRRKIHSASVPLRYRNRGIAIVLFQFAGPDAIRSLHIRSERSSALSRRMAFRARNRCRQMGLDAAEFHAAHAYSSGRSLRRRRIARAARRVAAPGAAVAAAWRVVRGDSAATSTRASARCALRRTTPHRGRHRGEHWPGAHRNRAERRRALDYRAITARRPACHQPRGCQRFPRRAGAGNRDCAPHGSMAARRGRRSMPRR